MSSEAMDPFESGPLEDDEITFAADQLFTLLDAEELEASLLDSGPSIEGAPEY